MQAMRTVRRRTKWNKGTSVNSVRAAQQTAMPCSSEHGSKTFSQVHMSVMRGSMSVHLLEERARDGILGLCEPLLLSWRLHSGPPSSLVLQPGRCLSHNGPLLPCSMSHNSILAMLSHLLHWPVEEVLKRNLPYYQNSLWHGREGLEKRVDIMRCCLAFGQKS